MAYNISKAALDQMTRCVALELAPKQVRCNSVNPGVTITELQKRGGLSEEAYANFLEKSKQTHALGRPGEVEEVARCIAFWPQRTLPSQLEPAFLWTAAAMQCALDKGLFNFLQKNIDFVYFSTKGRAPSLNTFLINFLD